MSKASTKSVFIQVESEEEQKEHLLNQRKTLKVLQGVAGDKENLTGRPPIDRLTRLKSNIDVKLASSSPDIGNKRKKSETKCAQTQTDANILNDLTTDGELSAYYWECLAERRRKALEQALSENQTMHERVTSLEDELNTTRQILEETHGLVEILKQMIAEPDKEDEDNDDDDNDDAEAAESEARGDDEGERESESNEESCETKDNDGPSSSSGRNVKN